MSLFDIFRKPAVPQAKPPTYPLGLRMKAGVEIDGLPFRLAADRLVFEPPLGAQFVERIGRIRLSEGATEIFRFYLTDDAFLQVIQSAGVVEAIGYFVFHETITPDNAAAFRAWTEPGSRIGAPMFALGDRSYERQWGEDPGRWSPPIAMDEVVFGADPSRPEFDLTHYAMLYARDADTPSGREHLLVSAEDYGPNEFCVVVSVGVPLTQADLRIT
ncbi:MAG: DUF2491 family protein [Xanthomonadaceae bacterium]|nr:DUF2491 family protein [Xanthomonadaceae bacterium]